MVTYMKGAIGIRLFGDGLSVFDMAVTTIVLLLFAIYLIKYFSESKKKIEEEKEKEEKTTDNNICDNSTEPLYSPQIVVVFQKDYSNEEELSKELADMYISNRKYYYSGKESAEKKQDTFGKNENSDRVDIKYEEVSFSKLAVVDV